MDKPSDLASVWVIVVNYGSCFHKLFSTTRDPQHLAIDHELNHVMHIEMQKVIFEVFKPWQKSLADLDSNVQREHWKESCWNCSLEIINHIL